MLKDQIKARLINTVLIYNDRREIIENLLKGLDVEINTWDFDYDRIYKKRYEDIEDWEEYYICSIDYTDLEDQCNYNYKVKIIDLWFK